MELIQLRCFVAVAEDLHFGRAAQRLDMLPASLGRHLRHLEDELGTQLVQRTTRHVSLTQAGQELVEEAKDILQSAANFEEKARNAYRETAKVLRVGAIDSASIGLVPQLLNTFRQEHPDVDISLHEQKTIRLLPRLLSGRLDMVFIRRPETFNPKIEFRHLLSETAVVAVPETHRFADRDNLRITDLEDEPMIVPERRSRPHSHDLTIKLFVEAGLTARIAQLAEEKHTIVNMVSSGFGLAIVPKWSARLAVKGVRYVPLLSAENQSIRKLDLSAAWVRNTRDPLRDKLIDCLERNLNDISAEA